jgi:ABC-2 type transport system permease protein
MALNPVLRRELTERWRTRRAGMTLTVALLVLALFQYLVYRIGVTILGQMGGRFGFGVDAATAGPLLGRFLLECLLLFVLLLVLFLTPGYAAGKLAGEWERRTLPLLQVTLLRPWQIVVGKLGASVAWLVLLVVAALPMGAASFFLGGVAVADLVRAIAYIIGIGIAVAGIALGVSGLSRRTAGSIVITYGIVLGLLGGTLFLAGVEAVTMARTGEFRTPRSLYANPFFGLADAAGAQRIGAGVELPSPLSAIASALPQPGGPSSPDGMFREEILIDPGPRFGPAIVQPDGLVGAPPAREPVWLQVLALYALAGAAGLVVASRRVRTAGAGRGVRRRRRGPVQAPVPALAGDGHVGPAAVSPSGSGGSP